MDLKAAQRGAGFKEVVTQEGLNKALGAPQPPCVHSPVTVWTPTVLLESAVPCGKLPGVKFPAEKRQAAEHSPLTQRAHRTGSARVPQPRAAPRPQTLPTPAPRRTRALPPALPRTDWTRAPGGDAHPALTHVGQRAPRGWGP